MKSAIAHLWFIIIHPFDDGNGRIARAISDLFLTRSEDTTQRFYSLSSLIYLEKNACQFIKIDTNGNALENFFKRRSALKLNPKRNIDFGILEVASIKHPEKFHYYETFYTFAA